MGADDGLRGGHDLAGSHQARGQRLVQFKSGTLALKIIAALGASGLPASRLELEITEAVLMRDNEAALALLRPLRAIGERIGLEDFVTGYSPLRYRQRFPLAKNKHQR